MGLDESFSVERTFGTLLFGGLLAFGFTGMVTVQCIVYFKLYPEDSLFKKSMVITVWMLDLLHSSLVGATLYYYIVQFFGLPEHLNDIPWSIPLSFFVTGMQTLITHSFFAHKIHRSSGSNWWITSPIIFLILSRLAIVTFATSEMILSKDFKSFFHGKFMWSFTAGLSLSAALDIVIAGWLFFFLRRIRRRMVGSSMMVTVVDSLTKYTLESGFLTCFAATAVLITWITIPSTFVPLGIHFTLAKLYINSLLASLNTRKELREMREQMEEATLPEPVFSPADFASIRPKHPAAIVNPLDVHLSSRRKPEIKISVRKHIEHSADSLGSLSDMMYPKTAPIRRPTVLEWRSRANRSMTSLRSAFTEAST